MDYRLRKQIIIASIFFLFLALLGVGFYFLFLKPAPSCFDNIKNQGEEEIDCGGPCVSCEIKTIKNIEVNWTKAVLLEDNVYDLVAQVRNPNPNFGTVNLRYRFILKNQAGQVIGSKEGITFILPGVNKYIIETNFSASQPVASSVLEIVNPEPSDWQKLKDYQIPNLIVKDKQFIILDKANYLAEASGVVKNNTSFDLDKVSIAVILFDRENEVLGVSKTEVRTLLSGEGRYFSVRWFSPLSGEVSSLDMQAETNLFLDENYMRKYGVPGNEF